MGVTVQQAQGNLVQGGLDRADLGQDVDAVTVLVDHLGDASYLTLDPREPLLQLLLAGCVAPNGRCVAHGHDPIRYPPWVSDRVDYPDTPPR